MAEDLRFKEAISKMNDIRSEKGVDINGKKYSMVKDRIETFRSMFPDYGIDTNVEYRFGFERGSVIVAAAKVIHIATGHIVASGHAMNFFGSDDVNTSSVVEVTETNAIGRALACFGLAGGEFASAQEMEALPAKRNGAQDALVYRQGQPIPPDATPKQRAFIEAVEKAIPPSITKYNFDVPDVNDKDALDRVFTQIDNINSSGELAAYYKAIEHMLQWIRPADAKDVKASFATRDKQLKGK